MQITDPCIRRDLTSQYDLVPITRFLDMCCLFQMYGKAMLIYKYALHPNESYDVGYWYVASPNKNGEME